MLQRVYSNYLLKIVVIALETADTTDGSKELGTIKSTDGSTTSSAKALATAIFISTVIFGQRTSSAPRKIPGNTDNYWSD